MTQGLDGPGRGGIDSLILRSLVRMLVARHILSADDVRALLVDAAARLDVLGGGQTPQAARSMAEEDLLPQFLDRADEGPGAP